MKHSLVGCSQTGEVGAAVQFLGQRPADGFGKSLLLGRRAFAQLLIHRIGNLDCHGLHVLPTVLPTVGKATGKLGLPGFAPATDLQRLAPPLAFGLILSLTESMVSTAYRYIVSEAGVRGGHARVEGTRIGVHDVIAYFLLGSNLEEVKARFPDLSRAQIYECLAYYEDHRSEVESLALPQTEKTAA